MADGLTGLNPRILLQERLDKRGGRCVVLLKPRQLVRDLLDLELGLLMLLLRGVPGLVQLADLLFAVRDPLPLSIEGLLCLLELPLGRRRRLFQLGHRPLQRNARRLFLRHLGLQARTLALGLSYLELKCLYLLHAILPLLHPNRGLFLSLGDCVFDLLHLFGLVFFKGLDGRGQLLASCFRRLLLLERSEEALAAPSQLRLHCLDVIELLLVRARLDPQPDHLGFVRLYLLLRLQLPKGARGLLHRGQLLVDPGQCPLVRVQVFDCGLQPSWTSQLTEGPAS